MNSTIEQLIGKTLTSIEISDDKERIDFVASDGSEYAMYHSQDCCEHVRLEDVVGDIDDLLNSPITQASEHTNTEEPKPSEYPESFTWTFYHIATVKGWVTLRWLGESNGYYSESVDFVQTTTPLHQTLSAALNASSICCLSVARRFLAKCIALHS